MKKILTALVASAFALTIYAAPSSACPGHDKDKSVTTKKEKKENDKAAEKKKEKKKEKKPAKEKVS
jgi:hypothetical protein